MYFLNAFLERGEQSEQMIFFLIPFLREVNRVNRWFFQRTFLKEVNRLNREVLWLSCAQIVFLRPFLREVNRLNREVLWLSWAHIIFSKTLPERGEQTEQMIFSEILPERGEQTEQRGFVTKLRKNYFFLNPSWERWTDWTDDFFWDSSWER